MFGPMYAGQVLMRMRQEREAAQAMPRRDVSKREFVQEMVAAGAKKREAERQANVSKFVGGYTRVGSVMLRVVDKRKRKR